MNEPRVVESVTNECQSLGRAHESSSARAEELIACLEGEIAKRDARIVELKQYEYAFNEWLNKTEWVQEESASFSAKYLGLHRADIMRDIIYQLLSELSTIKAQEPVAYIPVDRETGEEWHPVLRKGSGNICDYKPLYAAPVSEAKAQGVVMDGSQLAGLLEQVRLNDDEAKPHGSGATYWNNAVIACQVAIRDALDAPVQQVSVPDGWTVERGYSPNGYVLHSPSGSMIRVCDSGMGGIETAFAMFLKAMLAAAPAAPAADAGLVDMYRHLQKVTPYRFKKIHDASITDGGDVMYFHKDRFDAALLADMAALAAGKDAAP